MWSGMWSNTWPIHIIFKKRTNLISLLSDLLSLIHHPSSETSIDSTLVASRRCHWLATLVARCGHHQLVDRRSKTSTNIAIILIEAIYKEFFECWLSGIFITKLYLKSMRAWSSFSLVYQLIALPTPFQSSIWVREALGHRKARVWSGKKTAGWTQSENLLLRRQRQLLSIYSLLEVNSSW